MEKGHTEAVDALFREGYNCAQAVFCAFTDVTGMDRDAAARLSSSFGGGFGRLREVCGAVSGAAMVLGALEGYDDPKDPEAKMAHYERIREFAARFREKEETIICRELLAKAECAAAAEIGGRPQERDAKFYDTRPCPRLVHNAVQILDEMLAERAHLQK